MKNSRSARLRIGAVVAAIGASALVPMAGGAAHAAAAHVDNPFVGATQYVNPDWSANVNATAAATSDSSLAAKMRTVATYPTAVWMDRIAAIAGTSTSRGLAAHLDAALAQQQGSTPILATIVIYDLPGRDCDALASQGELPATAAGLDTYEHSYIDPITAVFSQSKYANLRIVTVVEPDSLPNIVTNSSVQACQQSGPFYEQGIAYTLNHLHAMSNVYTYLDTGHAGWLGWPNNSSGAAAEFAKVAKMTTAGFASVDGFITDTANSTPLKEPFFTGDTAVGGQPVKSANFYQYNPDVDEAAFSADMWNQLTAAGFPTSLGMLIDTSRNGWGGTARPTAASTSTDVNTFVNASKVDQRAHRGLWCNQAGAGLGEPPTAAPTAYPASHLDAYVWVKPPGESDGASTAIVNDQGKKSDPMCDPTFMTSYGVLTNALPNAPLAGQWFASQFTQLVQNAFPVVGSSTPPPVDTTAPSVPGSVHVTATTSSSVSLAWTASTDNVGVTGYDVYRGGAKVATTSTASYTDTGLTASTTYAYTVKAHDAAGNASAASTSVNGTTTAATGGDVTPPSTPGALHSTGVTSSSVSLAWTASTDNVGVSGYDVYRGSTKVATTSATSFTDTGLTASTAYSYTVVARDAAGNASTASSAATATTSAGTVTGGGGCTATWHNDNDWGSGFTGTVTVTAGSAAITGWSVTLTFAGNQAVTNVWNANGTASGHVETATSMPYNGSLAAGANTTFGFQATYSGVNAAPALTCASH